MPSLIGTRIGRYEVLAALGAGGMGEVYRAHDTRLGRDVALKVLPAALANDAERLARFEHEARTVAALNHPNIVTLYSVEDEAGTRFLTMELVDGHGLEREVVPGGLAIERVVEWGIALAEALAIAHAKGVVHRDLKPANVMLTSDGRLKVLDFGLAKLHAPASELEQTQAATIAAPVSDAGQVVGTVPYMAPEQLRGEAVDARTDQFAFGVLLYELTVGRRPFAGHTLGVIGSAILRDTPSSVSSLRADVPGDLERVIARCLEKAPSDRFAHMQDVAHELRRTRSKRADASTFHKAPPMPASPLLGREQALDAAAALVRDGARVLTVTGYGGTGKTRFAIALFGRLASEYPSGAAFVSLAAVTAADAVLPTLATTLELAESHGRSALDALSAVIADRKVLLVLDNLEQVLDCAEDLALLSARCAGLQIVATSRAPLKIGAETEYSLAPLELPREGEVDPDALRAYPSVALLLQRAEKVKPGFALTAANASAIAAICRRLDGLPLALELAAARIRILEPAALLQRLDQALDLLTSGDRDLPLRQRTLRATISWSYSLLGSEEQRLLRRLSVFHEGWTLEAMEQVCFDESERVLALDRFESLVEKGLVRVMGDGQRYALLETIRAFASEQLHAAGETASSRDAHAAYFVELSERIAAGIRSPEQLAAMEWGRADYANLMAAIAWSTSRARAEVPGALERALLLCGTMDWYWHITGQHHSARIALDDVLTLAKDAPPSRGRGLAYLANAMVSTTTGEWERSAQEWRAGFDDGVAVGAHEVAGEGAMGIGYTLVSTGKLLEALPYIDDAIARCSGRFHMIHGLSLTLRAMVRFLTGDIDAGIATIGEARRIHERQKDYEIGGVALSFLAQMHLAKGDTAQALTTYARALEELLLVGDLPEVARVQTEVGWCALGDGDTTGAQRSFIQAVHTHEIVGSARGVGLALLGLAAVEGALCHDERAVTIAAAAEAFSKRAGVVIAHALDPRFASRIEALKESIPKGTLDGLVAGAEQLTPAAVLTMVRSVSGYGAKNVDGATFALTPGHVDHAHPLHPPALPAK